MGAATERKPRKERTENAARRRRQLLDAARDSIRTHGLAKTTLATVADAAGLSQGVAVFYFKSKTGLLEATLRDLYESYESLWAAALDTAEEDPAKRLAALIASDFSAKACGPRVLPLWFAFWGELRFSGQYAEIAAAFDARRHEALTQLWAELLPEADPARIAQLTEWMESLSDGYWQHLHLAPHQFTRADGQAGTLKAMVALVPELQGRL